jgi:hypothetical protein
MLFTSNERYNLALKIFSQSTVICSRCGKKMYPYSKPFGKLIPEAKFLMAMCECGNHYKQLYNYINIPKRKI